jgi:hypothetical protein
MLRSPTGWNPIIYAAATGNIDAVKVKNMI